MFQQNSFISIGRRFFLLLIVFSSSLFGAFTPIYDLEDPRFEYSLEDGNYKVYLPFEGSIDYKNGNGFKLFLPNFVKEYNLGVLREHSIGTINGVLSTKEGETSISSKNIESSDIAYYLTDYASQKQRQLSYLLKNEKIPYFNKTSIAFQGYNIPKSISNNLNKWFFFSFLDNNQEDKLTTLLYSYSMVLDKKQVDNFVKKNKKIVRFEADESFNHLHTYLHSFSKVQHKVIEKPQYIKAKVESEERGKWESIKLEKNQESLSVNLGLDLKRVTEMKDFESSESQHSIQEVKDIPYSIENNYKALQETLNKLIALIEEIKITHKRTNSSLKNEENDMQLKEIMRQKDILVSKMANVEYERKGLDSQKCNPKEELFDRDCLEDKNYFDTYVYNAIQNGNLPKEDIILKNGSGKAFNNIGKYYYEVKNFKKSEQYLLKAYEKLLGNDKELVAYNLGVLYSTFGTPSSYKKACSYFEKTTIKEGYFNLGISHYNGQGVKENNKNGYEYFLKSANLGYERAQSNILKMERLYPSLKK